MDRDIRIVLVEDNIVDAAFTKRVLKHNKLNKDLIVATNGEEAMKALQAWTGEIGHCSSYWILTSPTSVASISLPS